MNSIYGSDSKYGIVNAGRPEYALSSALRDSVGRFVKDGVGFSWQGLDLFDQSMKKYADDWQDYRRKVAAELGPVMEQYMKANAPWKDRTGLARDGLKAVVVHRDKDGSSDISLGHSMFYGIFLEDKTYGGISYAIILPTIRYFAPIFAGKLRAHR